jgi:hypothetical protein
MNRRMGKYKNQKTGMAGMKPVVPVLSFVFLR